MILSCDEKGNKYLIINNKIISSLDSAIVLGIIEILSNKMHQGRIIKIS